MAFKDIVLEDVDTDNMKLTERNTVIVPYILSDEPPKPWKEMFLLRINRRGGSTPVSFDTVLPHPTTEISGKQVLFECSYNKDDIRKRCWDIVEAHVKDSNDRYREYERSEIRKQEQRNAERQAEETKQKEFEAFKRELKK